MELPIYKLIVNDDPEIEVNAVAIVDKPATERYAQFFNEQKSYNFQVFNEDKRLAMGPLMVADKPIYRKDEDGREYYVILDAENIDNAMIRFYERDYHKNVNMMHDPKQSVEGMVLYQHFIINKEMGIKTPKGFDTLPDGSSFGIYKVKNDEVWNTVKNGQFGFSIEGLFKQMPISIVTPEHIDGLMNALKKVGVI